MLTLTYFAGDTRKEKVLYGTCNFLAYAPLLFP